MRWHKEEGETGANAGPPDWLPVLKSQPKEIEMADDVERARRYLSKIHGVELENRNGTFYKAGPHGSYPVGYLGQFENSSVVVDSTGDEDKVLKFLY